MFHCHKNVTLLIEFRRNIKIILLVMLPNVLNKISEVAIDEAETLTCESCNAQNSVARGYSIFF